MQNCTPSYSFSNANQQRTFHHRWHTNNGQIYECQACRSTCAANQSYAAHWQTDPQQNAHSMKQLALVQLIDSVKLEKFILCNKNVQSLETRSNSGAERHQFLLDAGMKALPEFLHLMWRDADEISLQLGLYVRVKETTSKFIRKEKNLKTKKSMQEARRASAACEACETAVVPPTTSATQFKSDNLSDVFEADGSLLFKSSFLNIATHYDIEESIDVLLIMLLECIERHLAATLSESSEYEVQRIEINMKRIKAKETLKQFVQLPLQYSVKRACAAQQAVNDDAALSASKPKANIYCFKTCRYTGELFVVPYLLSTTSAYDTPNYIMTSSSSAAETFRLLRIKSLRKFLRHETGDCVLSCKCCNAKFMQQTKLELHKRLQCGRDFKVLKMAADLIELYECCLPLQCAVYNWPLYGIIE